MKFSIVTVTFNSDSTLEQTIESVSLQDHKEIEYIVIDGGSSDRTLDIIERNKEKVNKLISEVDKGIYDAMNKGILASTGEVIAFLHSDDLYFSKNILSTVNAYFESLNLDALFGDVNYFQHNDPSKIVRRYRSNRFSPQKIGWGWMPAHPSLFLHRRVYEKYGLFKIDYKIAGDYEFVARIFRHEELKYQYLPQILVNMRMGGVSTGGLNNSVILNKEVLRACRENDISTNIFKVLSKYPAKLLDSFLK
jgi:glycosyltransferase involved in cell wall biosynthesis